LADKRPPGPQSARVDVSGAIAKLRALDRAIDEEASNLVFNAAEQGEQFMKRRIEESGTDFSARAQAAGINKGPGRQRSGKMHRDVTKQVQRGGKKTFAAFGWLKNFENYYLLQEQGFRNRWLVGDGGLANFPNSLIMPRDGAYYRTPGMFALRDARTYVRDVWLPRSTAAFKGAIRRKVK
jgi:hypothetical protein